MFTPLFFEGTSKGRRLFVVIMSVGISVSILMTSVFTQHVYGYTAVKGTVKAKSGIVRESASTSAACAFCVKSGEEVVILSEETGNDSKIWYKIKVQDSTGYIRSDLVTKSNVKVNVDTEPVEEKSKENAAENNSEGNTSEGNTSGGFTSQVGKVKSSGVNVRKEPVDGKIVTRVTAGDSITAVNSVTGSDGNLWYAISFVQDKKALNGYIRADFTEGITPPDTTASTTAGSDTATETATNLTPSVKTGMIRGTSVRIRDKEVSGAVVVQLNPGHAFTVLDEVKGEDNYSWYKISFNYQGTNKEGYVRSDLVTLSAAGSGTNVAASDESFEQTIAELPDSYKNSLRTLHSKYPNWKFVPVNTGLKWDDVVSAECVVGKNLTAMSSIASWKSTDPKAYNQAKGEWYGFDGGAWAAASEEVIKFYLDPRNFLDDTGIFQFETLDYEEYQTDAGVSNILAGSFMNGSYVDTDGVTRSYPSTFTDAGKAYGISPYHLASRCLQEQGLYGKSDCVSGTVPGFENYFNYFNIGAYAANGLSATTNGLKYAMGTDESTGRPWNSRFASIVGSAKYISEKYVKKGQNTLYFQKFNVVNSENGIYSHQYMSNICAASVEASSLKKAYTDPNSTLVFKIPYYSGMPDNTTDKPVSSSSPSNYLSALSIGGYNYTPEFSGAVDQYNLTVDSTVTNICISATPADIYATVGGTGNVPVYVGTNVYHVVVKAQNGSTKTYTITVVQK